MASAGNPAARVQLVDYSHQYDWMSHCFKCGRSVPLAMFPICRDCELRSSIEHTLQEPSSFEREIRRDKARRRAEKRGRRVRRRADPRSRFDYAGSSEDAGYSDYAVESMIEALLEESPEISTLKKHQVQLTPQERSEVMKSGAVWSMGKDGGPSPAVRKAIVNGKIWFWCATHRYGQVKSTLKSAIRAFHHGVKQSA